MKILYIDCFLGFSAQMLIGALADLGADVDEINRRLAAGLPSAVLKTKKTERSMLECTLAEVDANGAQISENNGGLFAKTLEIYRRFCKKELTDSEISKIAAQSLCVEAAAEILEVQFVMCSSVSIGSLCAETEASAQIFKSCGIPFGSSDEKCTLTCAQDAAFLAALVNEYGPMPDVNIEKIGYGAGEKDLSSPNLIRAVLGSQNDMPICEMFESMTEETSEEIAVCI